MAEEEEAEDEGGKSSGPSKMLLIAIFTVGIAAGAGVGVFLAGGSSGSDATDGEAEEVPVGEILYPGPILPLDPFVVNLGAKGSFLKVVMHLEFQKAPEGVEEAATVPAVITERMPLLKNTIIKVLSTLSADELLTNEGKDKVRELTRQKLNEAIDSIPPSAEDGEAQSSEDEDDEGEVPEVVTNIYFSEFILQ